MKTIEEMVLQHISNGMTDFQAKNYVCQKIIINKISKSPMADRVLIKGGVVMFNLTKNLRRTTSDLGHRMGILGYSIIEMKMSLGC